MEGGGWGGPGTESENRTVVKVYGGEKMTWQGECFLISGVFGFSLVVLLGLSSLPSVSASLTWKEFAFIQSGLGWVAMILLCAHDMFYGWSMYFLCTTFETRFFFISKKLYPIQDFF